MTGTIVTRETIALFDSRPCLGKTRAGAELFREEVFRAGQFLHGEQVRLFEVELAGAFGGQEAVACGSGTSALELCLRAIGVSADEDVIVPANTSLFTAQAVLAAGARLRFADVDEGTLQLTAKTAEAAWTERTRAVVGVHLYGNACGVGELAELCGRRGAVLVQDACQGHGLRVEGRALSDFSPYVAYSFYPTKNLGGIGDGGAVVTSSADVAEHARLLRDGGRSGDQVARMPGINSRLAELHAAYLRAALPYLGEWNAARRRNANIYNEGLRGVVRLVETRESVRHQFVIRTERREELRAHLRGAGIETGVHYPHPLQEHPGFAGRSSWEGELGVATRAAQEVLSLPVGPHVGESHAARVVDEVGRFFR